MGFCWWWGLFNAYNTWFQKMLFLLLLIITEIRKLLFLPYVILSRYNTFLKSRWLIEYVFLFIIPLRTKNNSKFWIIAGQRMKINNSLEKVFLPEIILILHFLKISPSKEKAISKIQYWNIIVIVSYYGSPEGTLITQNKNVCSISRSNKT